MRFRYLIILTIIFLAASIAFAIGYDKLYSAGPHEQKGDYIFFCLNISALLGFLYLIAAKFSLRKKLPIIVIFIGPFITCIASLILTIIACFFIEDTRDQKVLQLFLVIQGFSMVLFILPFVSTLRRGGVVP